MSTLSTVPYLPLYPFTLSDWLPKLGEKAFLAWLNFHSWKDQLHSTAPTVLPFSLNQLTKRLKVGNSTFYNQILRPLFNYGLIDLRKTPGTNQCLVTVYLYPENCPEKALQPLSPFRDYDHDFVPCTSSSPQSMPTEEETISPEWDVHPPNGEQITVSMADKPQPPEKDVQPDSRSPITTLPKQPTDLPIFSLPPILYQAIHSDSELLLRKESIETVYMKWKDHPRYTDQGYLNKIQTCLRYSRDKERFAAYLHKALQNEWNTPLSPPPTPHSNEEPDSIPPCPPDVPIYVWRQIHCPLQDPGELTAAQIAELDDLKRALGEL